MTDLFDEVRRYYDQTIGPDGGGGGTAPGTYTYDAPSPARQGAPSGQGIFTMAGPQDNPATIWISTSDTSGTDQSARIALVVSGTVLRFDQTGDAAKWQEYVAVGPGVPDGPSARFDGVVHWDQGTLLDDGAAVTIIGRPMTAEERQRWEGPQSSGGSAVPRKRKATT